MQQCIFRNACRKKPHHADASLNVSPAVRKGRLARSPYAWPWNQRMTQRLLSLSRFWTWEFIKLLYFENSCGIMKICVVWNFVSWWIESRTSNPSTCACVLSLVLFGYQLYNRDKISNTWNKHNVNPFDRRVFWFVTKSFTRASEIFDSWSAKFLRETIKWIFDDWSIKCLLCQFCHSENQRRFDKIMLSS